MSSLSSSEGSAPSSRSPSLSTLLSHSGVNPNHTFGRGLSPAIDLSTTFERGADGSFPGSHIYSRCTNPTRDNLEAAILQLETFDFVKESPGSSPSQFASTSSFSSGMAAVSTVLMARQPNCHVLLPKDCYHGVSSQLITVLQDCGVGWEVVEMSDRREVADRLTALSSPASSPKRSVILWLESPSNPLTTVLDAQELTSLAREIDPSIFVLLDSTWSPPPLTRSLHPSFGGVDAVLHSCTKYFGGHSDVLMGCVTTSRVNSEWGAALGDRIKSIQASIGAVPSPFECFLCLRGMRTMHLRLARQCETAQKVADFLTTQEEKVVKVHYPGLERHPQHEIAKRQMKGGFGGMLSFEVGGEGLTAEEKAALATKLLAKLKVFTRATSLGGTESLVEHRASIEPKGRVVSPPGLVRVSIGLEDAEDLIEDLRRALNSND